MLKKSQATITDVAKAAGVAVGTVSRVLNNHTDVNAGIRARVWEAARTLSYSRIRQRSTRREESVEDPRSEALAAVFFGMEDTLVQLPVVSTALQGIEGAIASKGRSLMLANIPKGDRVPPFLLGNHVAGLIIKGPNQGDLPPVSENGLLQHIFRFPHVWLMGRPANATGDHCNFDTEAAGRIATEHLVARGHRRLAFLNPKPGQIQFEKLRQSFLQHCRRLGATSLVLEPPPPENLSWPLPAITQENTVRSLLERWQATPAELRPTALFVPSDRAAVQVYSVMSQLNLHVGTDLSLISCNNERSLLMNLHPTVTTVDVHAEAVGRHAVDQLLWRIANPQESRPVQVLIEPTLVEGESVATLPTHA